MPIGNILAKESPQYSSEVALSVNSEVSMAKQEQSTTFSKETDDTLALAQEAVKAGLIPRDVLDHLTSLDPQVPGSVKHRYFLSQVNNTLRADEELLTRIITVFLKHSSQTEVTSTRAKPARQNDIVFSVDQLSDLTEVLAEYSFLWKPIGIALKFKPQDLDNIESSPKLLFGAPNSHLIKLLTDWLEKKHPLAKPPTLRVLKKALSSQIVGLGSVAHNLQDKLTIENRVPYSLTNISIQLPFNKESIVTVMNYNRHKALHVQENNTVLLEILATTDLEKSIFLYEWLKDGEKIQSSKEYSSTYTLSSEKYSGISQPVLCISQADISTDACEFSCRVTLLNWNSRPTMTTPTILNVSCLLDKYRDTLSSIYLAKPEVPEDTWPPVSSKKYINLALIKQKQVNYGEQYARLTIRGDMDDILQHKETIRYEDFLKGIRSGQVMFVEGRPGCGKTTFVHKITRDWATRSRGHMRLVLLVSLRVLNNLNKPNLDLADILQMFKRLTVSKELVEERNGKGVCFIFDGLDEFSPRDGRQSIVYKIICKEYLNQATVIVASRPAAIAHLRNKADRVIEVLGFRKEQILEYFDHYPFPNTNASELKTYLLSHPNILHMCYLPIHACMVAFLFEVTGKVPRTETEIYTHFTRLTLLRSLSKNKDVAVEDIDVYKLSGKEEELFKQICKFAMEKTILNKQVLHQDDVKLIFKDKDISLGLITIDRTASLYGYKDIYTFLHLTFQEYLAAYHISTLTDKEQNMLIHEHGGKNHMLVVWKFYCGLVRFDLECNKFKEFLQTLECTTVYYTQCAYESQQPTTSKLMLQKCEGHLNFEGLYLTTPDFTALGYVIHNAISPFVLSLTNCNINFEAIDALLSEVTTDKSLLHTFNFTSHSFDHAQRKCLEKLLLRFRSLRSLGFSAIHKEGNSDRDAIASIIKKSCANVTELCLVNTPVSHRSLETALNHYRSLEKLVLADNRCTIRKEEILVLVRGLRNLKNFKKLNISHNYLQDEDVILLATGLEFCSTLETICIHVNEISSRGLQTLFSKLRKNNLKVHSKEIVVGNNTTTEHLLHSLRVCQNLQELHLNTLSLGEEDTSFFTYSQNWKRLHTLEISCKIEDYMALVEYLSGIKHLHSLEELTISGNSIREHRALVLGSSIRYCTRLKRLNLFGNGLTAEGITAISTGLRHCSSLSTLNLGLNNIGSALSTLNLGPNNIGSEGVRTISTCLQHWPNLHELSLSSCGIDTAGAKALATSLHHCTQLTRLTLTGNSLTMKQHEWS